MEHLGIIMDGNRRWAKNKFLPAFYGHKAGADNVKKIVKKATRMGIKYITLWALSLENLKKRDQEEIKGIIKLINNIESYLNDMLEDNLQFDVIGDLSLLPKRSRDILDKIKLKTKDNKGITMILALAYSGQNEIIRGFKKFISKGGNINTLDEKEFLNYIDTGKFPNPDMIVRTGGDIRNSGFLQYVSPYSEYYYSSKFWPDFSEDDLEDVMKKYNNSNRNFGK